MALRLATRIVEQTLAEISKHGSRASPLDSVSSPT
jgi:hypothetical protein